jgi:hypothetical protein
VGAASLLLLGVVTSWLATSRHGYDYMHLYLTTYGVASGAPIYDSAWRAEFVPQACGRSAPGEGVFYPPGTGVAMLLLAPLSCGAFAHVLHVLLIAAVIAGAYWLVKLFKPEAPRGTWVWVAGLVLLSACVRWGMTHLQSAPLMFGALALEIAALHGRRPALAALVACFASALKVTMGPPFVVLLLMHRRFAAALGVGAVVMVLNALGFWRMGGASALAGYRAAVGSLERAGTINTANPLDPQAGIRLDWVALFTGLTGDLSLARLLALGLAVGIGVWLLRTAYRLPQPLTPRATAALALPLVCVNLLITYHHAYDVTVLWAPLLPMLLMIGKRLVRPDWATLLALPLLAIMALLPIEVTKRLATSLVGDAGMVALRIAFPVAMTLALAASLIHLRSSLQSKPEPDLAAAGV